MYGQFWHQLRNDILQQWPYKDGLSGRDLKLVDLAIRCLEHRGRRRAREALVKGMNAEKRYHFDTEFRYAVDTIINVVVPAAFGDVPGDPDQLEKAVNVLIQSATTPIWSSVTMGKNAGKSKPVTMDDVLAAKKKLDAAHPPTSGLAGTKTGRFSVKGDPAPSGKETVAQLLKMVEGKAKELQEEKTAQDMGMSIEEAKTKYPGVFGNGDTWEFTTTIDMTED